MNQPCHSTIHGNQRKRKHSNSSSDNDDENPTDPLLMTKVTPLSVQPIENEFELLDEGEDEHEDEEEEEEANKEVAALKKQEYKDILDAQEYTNTQTSYGDIKLTPFNLEEELEEGKFDNSGNYIFNKEKKDDENNDAWAESVDWDAVEKKAKEEEERRKLAMQGIEEEGEDHDDDEKGQDSLDKLGSYKQMLRLMQPDETVQKTIRRLANAVPKRTRPQKGSKNSTSTKSTTQTSSQAENCKPPAAEISEVRAKLDLMIELAHQRLEEGEVDIYQMSYEDLEEAINC